MLSRRSRGFSLIELSVALTIAGILLILGAPAFSQYLQNARLGAMAQSVYGGMQTARAEAVKLNRNVEFVLTSSTLESSTADSVIGDATGRNWMVRQRTSASQPYAMVEQKTNSGSDVGGVLVAASQPTFTFNSLGSPTTATATGIAFTNPQLGLCLPAGPVRCWNVVVGVGGQVRLCSPDSTLGAGDSRGC